MDCSTDDVAHDSPGNSARGAMLSRELSGQEGAAV